MAPHTIQWHSCWWNDELTWLSWRSFRGLDLRSDCWCCCRRRKSAIDVHNSAGPHIQFYSQLRVVTRTLVPPPSASLQICVCLSSYITAGFCICILLSVLANRFLSLVLCDRYQTAYITCTPLLVSDWQQTAFTESDEHFLRFVAFIVFLCRFFFFLPFFSFFIVFCFIRTLSKR